MQREPRRLWRRVLKAPTPLIPLPNWGGEQGVGERSSAKYFRYYDAETLVGVIHMSQCKKFPACNFFGQFYVYMSNSTLMTTWGSR